MTLRPDDFTLVVRTFFFDLVVGTRRIGHFEARLVGTRRLYRLDDLGGRLASGTTRPPKHVGSGSCLRDLRFIQISSRFVEIRRMARVPARSSHFHKSENRFADERARVADFARCISAPGPPEKLSNPPRMCSREDPWSTSCGRAALISIYRFLYDHRPCRPAHLSRLLHSSCSSAAPAAAIAAATRPPSQFHKTGVDY